VAVILVAPVPITQVWDLGSRPEPTPVDVGRV